MGQADLVGHDGISITRNKFWEEKHFFDLGAPQMLSDKVFLKINVLYLPTLFSQNRPQIC